MKVYIVGAVTGVENWEEKFAKAKFVIEAFEHDVKTPMDYPKGLTQKEYMILSCESVFWADSIVVTKDWENSKGTKAEIALAESYGLPVDFVK